MAENKISPEEKLLKLIRSDKTESKQKNEAELPEKKKIKGLRKIVFHRLDIRHITIFTQFMAKQVLLFIIILLFCLMGYGARFSIKKDRINFMGQETRREKKEIHEESVALKPYSYYTHAIAGKSLFTPLVIEKSTDITAKTESIEDLCKNYQLKGVILGERPEAFVEDVKARRTFTVTIGDTIGKIQVKDIKEGRMTLGYEEESYDLFF